MSKMLVAYTKCGCRIAVLLDADDAVGAAAMRFEAEDEGWTLREEEHERIGVGRCATHEAEWAEGRAR